MNIGGTKRAVNILRIKNSPVNSTGLFFNFKILTTTNNPTTSHSG